MVLRGARMARAKPEWLRQDAVTIINRRIGLFF
jgi:hypothetical protein